MDRTVLLAASALSLLLAGCFGPATPDDGSAADQAPDSDWTFTGPTLVGGGGHPAVGEASLAIGPAGELLTCTVGTPIIYASLDGGATWSPHDPFEGSWNGDCDVAVAGDGTWVVVFSKPSAFYDLPSAPTVSEIATSSDQGNTWSRQTATRAPAQCPHTVNSWVTCALHRPWLHVDGDRVDLTYQDLLPTIVLFQRSTDAAASWSDPVPAAADPGHGAAGRMIQSPDGQTLWIPVYYTEPTFNTDGELQAGPSRIDVARSTDGGVTWASQTVASDVLVGPRLRYGMPSVAEWDDRLYVGAAIANGTAADVVLFMSDDGDLSWSEPVSVATGIDFGGDGRGHFKVNLDIGPNGLVGSWYHRDPLTGWMVDVAGLDRAGDVKWSGSSPGLGGDDLPIEFFGTVHDAAGVLHVMVPVPEARCADGGPHCLYHLALPPPQGSQQPAAMPGR